MPLQTPGALFLGTLVPSEQKFIKKILVNALKSGYNKVVEPCCGAFAMSHLAVQAGFKPEQVEASDVTMFSSIYGYGIMQKPLDDLGITAKDFTEEECKDYASMLYAILYYRSMMTAGSDFFYAMLRDLECRKQDHIAKMEEYVTKARASLKGFSYRAMDMYEHIGEVMNDPRAIIIANPPTYRAGFEKWYDTGGNMSWNEPSYSIFDPKTGLVELMQDRMANAKALIICYEENETGKFAGKPIFSRYGVRKGVNVYLTTNREQEATDLANGKTIVRPNETKLESLKCSILPDDFEFTEETKVDFMQIQPYQANYYRGLWTHNFCGSASQVNVAMFVDGKIAGVFGYNLAIGGKIFDELLIMYGVTSYHKNHRLNRLLTMVAVNEGTIRSLITDYQFSRLKGVKTTQLTKYPESKEMRGLMKMVSRDKGSLGYKLVYRSDIMNRDNQQTLVEWLKREKQWMKERVKTKID